MFATHPRHSSNAENEHPEFGASWATHSLQYTLQYPTTHSPYSYARSQFSSPPASPASTLHSYSPVAGYLDHHGSPHTRRRNSGASARITATSRHVSGTQSLGSDRHHRHRSHGENRNDLAISYPPCTPKEPSNTELIPQVSALLPLGEHVTKLYNPIAFRRKGFPEMGVRVGMFYDASKYVLEGENDLIFVPLKLPGHQVTVTTQWTAYPEVEFNTRLDIKTTTMRKLAGGILKILDKYATWVKSKHIPTAIGYESFALEGSPSAPPGGGIKVEDIIVTQIIHSVNGTWQVELCIPKAHQATRVSLVWS